MLKYIVQFITTNKYITFILQLPLIVTVIPVLLLWDHKMVKITLKKSHEDQDQEITNTLTLGSLMITALFVILWLLFTHESYSSKCINDGGVVLHKPLSQLCYLDGKPHQIEGYSDSKHFMLLNDYPETINK